MLKDLLEDMGCEILFAENGRKAFELAQRERPDVVLLDIMMPEMDGYEVCRQLRAHAELAAIPVIMLTGHNIEDSARRGIDVGAEDVLGKPFNMSELKLRVKTVLQLNRYRLLAGERSLFAWVVEHSEAGYVMLRADDVVTYLNPQAALYLNVGEYHYPRDEQTFFDLCGTAFERIPEAGWSGWPDLEGQVFLVRPETREQRPLWLRVERLALGAEHAHARVLRLLDVTQDMLMFQSIWQFEHMVSHKLRTPLMALMGSLDLLEAKGMGLPDEVNGLVMDAAGAARQLNGAIKGVLEHLGSRQGEGPEQSCLVERLESYIKQLHASLGIEHIHVKCDPDLYSHTVPFSDDEVILILQEILGNAQKFHPENDPVVHVRMKKGSPSLLRCEVLDDGKHLSQEVLQRMGTPFFQAEKHFTGEVPGMGLGLSMVSTLIGSRGGRLNVTNRDDRPGLVVALELPLRS